MYTKQTWADGDVLLASKLNHIEDGIEAIQLPKPTFDQQGQYLAVVEDYDNTTDVIVIPQQTVTLTNQQEQVTYDFSSVPEYYMGQYIPATIEVNGVQYSGLYNGDNDISIPTEDSSPYHYFRKTSPKFLSDSWYWLVLDSNNITTANIISGTYIVKCTLHLPSAKWGLVTDYDDGGGDIIVT